MPALHIRLSGRVQGVGFRYACCRQAQALGLTGWTRNCPDGSVEIVAEGTADALAALRAWCGQGPRGALVERMETGERAATGAFSGFGVRA
jgi:acylphosphatase